MNGRLVISLLVGGVVIGAMFFLGAISGTSSDLQTNAPAAKQHLAPVLGEVDAATRPSESLGKTDLATTTQTSASPVLELPAPGSDTIASQANAQLIQMREQIARQAATIRAQDKALAAIAIRSQPNSDNDPIPDSANSNLDNESSEELDEEPDSEQMGPRDPGTIYSAAEIDTAIAEVESLIGSAIAQGGYTSFDEQRYMQLRKYLPIDTAEAFTQRFMTAIHDGVIVKYE